jgi:hypothetical protein
MKAQESPSRQRLPILGLLIFGMVVCGLLSGCGRLSEERSLDDAALLLIAVYQRMDAGDPFGQSGRTGLMALARLAPKANGGNLNEIEMLIRIREQLYADQAAKADELYSGVQAERIKASLEAEQQAKIDQLVMAADRLRKSRARRRRGLFGLFRRIGHGIANVVARSLRGIGKVTRFVVTKLGPDLVRDMVMKRVQALNALIQGRFDLMWDRVRGRLGGPLTELLRSVVDRAFVRERDRLIARFGMGGGDAAAGRGEGEDQQAVDASDALVNENGHDEGFGCGDRDWVDDYLEGVQGELLAEGRNCNPGAANQFQDCLEERVLEGLCKDEALDACQPLLDSIPSNLPGDGATLTSMLNDSSAVRDEVSITLPAGGGAVSGEMYYEKYDAVFICTFKVTTVIQGTFDPVGCSLNGTAQIDLSYEGLACPGVCGSGPNAPAPCPVTRSGSTVWKAELVDGELVGDVGDDSCDPYCFMFSASQ